MALRKLRTVLSHILEDVDMDNFCQALILENINIETKFIFKTDRL